MSQFERPSSAPLIERVERMGVRVERPPSPFRKRDAEAPELVERLGKLGLRTLPNDLSYAYEGQHQQSNGHGNHTSSAPKPRFDDSSSGPAIRRPEPIRAHTPASSGAHLQPPKDHVSCSSWSPDSQRTLLQRLSKLGVAPANVTDSPMRRPSIIRRQYQPGAVFDPGHARSPSAPVRVLYHPSADSDGSSSAGAHSAPNGVSAVTPGGHVNGNPATSARDIAGGGGGGRSVPQQQLEPQPQPQQQQRQGSHERHRRRKGSKSGKSKGGSVSKSPEGNNAPNAAGAASDARDARDARDAGDAAANAQPAPAAEPSSEPALVSVVKPSQGPTGIRFLAEHSDHGKLKLEDEGSHHKGPHQNTMDPWTVTADDIAPPMLKDGDYIDSLTFIAVTTDACVLLTQLLVSNLGMSARAGVQVKLTGLGGVKKFVKDEMPVKNLDIQDNGLTLRLSDRNEFRWDDERQTGHVRIKNPKEGIDIELVFEAEGGGYKIGDGMCSFGPRKFQFLAYPAPRAIVSGRATVGGNVVNIPRALGFVSHAYQNMRAHNIACRWHMVKFHAHDEGVSVNVNVGVAPKSHGHVPMGNAVFCRDGIVEVCGVGGSVRFPTYEIDKKTGYQVPHSAVYSVRGKDSLGREVEIDLPVPEVNVVERLDVLAELPWVLRQIIKAFIAKPYFYVFLNEIEAVIRVEGRETRCRGVIVHEILYLNAGPNAPE